MAVQQKLSHATEANPWIFHDFSLAIPDVKSHLLPVDSDTDDPNPIFHEAQRILKLPDLESFKYGPLETIPTGVESIRLESEIEDEKTGDEDLWVSTDLGLPTASRTTKTWEEFYDKGFSEPTVFLSEANEAVWNAVWKRFERTNRTTTTNVAIRRDYVVQCLVDLGLGLQSTLFTFDAAGRAHTRDDVTFSGISRSLTLEIVKVVGSCGESGREIEDFVKQIRSNSRSPQTLTTVTSAIDRVVNIIRQHIVEQSSKATTILQVRALFQLPNVLLSKLRSAIRTVLACKDDVAVINSMIELVEKYEAVDEWFRPLILQILVLTVKPFLDQVSQCIGLLPIELSLQSSNIPFHELLEFDMLSTNATIALSELSNLFDETQKRNISMIYQSLNLLKIHQSDRNLLYPKHWSRQGLELAITWDDIEQTYKQLEDITIEVETDISSTKLDPTTIDQVKQTEETPILNFNPYGSDTASILQNMLRSVKTLNSANIPHDEYQSDCLSRATHSVLHNEFDTPNHSILQPPFEMLKIESFTPLLSAQSHTVNRACLEMVLKDHNLLHNLDVLYELHLLGSGIFTTRLKEALFSAELSSAERKKGYHRAGQLGLRLGSRSTWPPASAELRLALMGILAECYHVSFPDNNLGSSDDLPGGLSFAIRNLSEPEIEACMDSQSLAALDFLRLQYQPPKALGSVISESALEKYDQIFRLLLRLSRVSFAVNQMWMQQRSSRHNPDHTITKYTHEAHHFISELTAYVYTSIATTWTHFRHILSTVETQLDRSDDNTTSLFQLSALHDLMLDKITSDLLLRHRYEKARQTLDQILTSILQLAFASDAQHAQIAFSNFRSHVKLFISICRRLVDRGSHRQQENALLSAELKKAWDGGASSMDGLQSLLLGLDFNGIYSAK